MLLIVPLALTLGWKAAWQAGAFGEFKEENIYLKVGDFLVRQRFAVALPTRLDEAGTPVVRASAGACQMLLTRMNPLGVDDHFRRQATTADVIFVVFRGRVYDQQPVWRTTLEALWWKFKWELGLRSQASPAFVVVANRNCRAELLPWAELQ
jgi:hypothetical protein